MVKCASCQKETSEGVKVNCPRCKKEMFRCTKCRALSIEYKCNCGFEGP